MMPTQHASKQARNAAPSGTRLPCRNRNDSRNRNSARAGSKPGSSGPGKTPPARPASLPPRSSYRRSRSATSRPLRAQALPSATMRPVVAPASCGAYRSHTARAAHTAAALTTSAKQAAAPNREAARIVAAAPGNERGLGTAILAAGRKSAEFLDVVATKGALL